MNKTLLILSANVKKFSETYQIFSTNGWKVEQALSIEEGIVQIKQIRPLVILISNDEQAFQAEVIIQEVKKIFSDSFLIILLENPDMEAVVQIHNKGVYKILLDLEPKQVLEVSENAFNIYNIKLMQRTVEENKESLIIEKYERLYWKESMMLNSDMSLSLGLVRTLRNYFAQANIGALISMIKLVEDSFLPSNDGSYTIDGDFMKEIFTSANVGNKVLESLNQYIYQASDECNFKTHNLSDFFELLFHTVDHLNPLAKSKGIRFIRGSNLYLNSNSLMEYDIEKVSIVMKELLINAAKFSKKGDKVFIIPIATANKVGFQIINTAYPYRKGVVGIPVDYQKKIFEPFFKMVEYSDTHFFEEEITSGLGLGLTLVKSIIEKHGAGVTINNVLDHFENPSSPTMKIMTEVSFIRE
jgi:signal transduction histidine kinase